MKIIFVLVSLRSLYNVGSIFRTADALGAEKIYLTGFTGTPKQSKVKKTALGAEDSVPWEHIKSTSQVIRDLKVQGYQIIGAEKNDGSLDIRKWKSTEKSAILLGNEERGLSPRILKLCDQVVHLPMEGMKESLNVSVTAGAFGYVMLEKENPHS
jgi:23S rRNA (guanosine2251-2'-O)-methyltransferase